MSEDKRARNEIIKENSRYLRGTIADGLSHVETGAIAEDDTQLLKFHGSYMQDDRDHRGERAKKKLEKAYSFMIRLRIPGGVVTPKQWLQLDDIAIPCLGVLDLFVVGQGREGGPESVSTMISLGINAEHPQALVEHVFG